MDSLRNQPATIDIAKYRATLKNQAIVDEAEKLLQAFKPVTYDVTSQIKAIEAFEAKAVRPFSFSFGESVSENSYCNCVGHFCVR